MAPAPELSELIAVVEADSGDDDLLRLLATASTTAHELAETSDALVGHFVDRCRRAGLSWAQISAGLGVSRQAAHKRFSPAPDTLDRFTPRARLSLQAGAVAATALGHPFVGTEHLLLGLLEAEGSVAHRLVTGSGLTRGSVAAAVVAHTPRGPSTTTEPPYTPRAAEALSGALAEAQALGHNYVGTEHLVLALFGDPEGLAAQILAEAGATHEGYRARTVQLLSGFRSDA